jgi:hypothetical protein
MLRLLRSVTGGGLLGALVICAALAGAAQAETFATITPSLYPRRLGARGALVLTIRFAAGQSGVPSPVRRSVVKFPAGLRLEIPSLRGCSTARLQARGPAGCPAQSELGTGHALVQARAGSQIISENVALWVFLGPLRNLQPTFEILGQGHTPLQERVVITGMLLADRAPFGEELEMSIPEIPTLPLEPDASIVTLTLTVGARGERPSADANAIVAPSRCPAGGFPFAAEITYADGSEGSALATVQCPR